MTGSRAITACFFESTDGTFIAWCVAARSCADFFAQGQTKPYSWQWTAPGPFTVQTPVPTSQNGSSITPTVTLTASQSPQNTIVDFELWSGGVRQAQTFASGVNFTASTPLATTLPAASAQPGTYTMKVGVFDANWVLIQWFDDAGTLTVT